MDSAIQQMNLPKCLATYAPNNIFETFCEVTTIEESLASKAPSLMSLTKREDCSKRQVYGLLQLHLMMLSNNAKVKNPLSKMEVDMLASDILKDFYFLTFADISIIMRKFYHGEYGKLYGALTTGDIYQWFANYASERCETAYEQNLQRDRARYESDYKVDENFSLEQLCYVKDEKTGAWRIDPEKVKQRNEEDKARAEREQQRKEKERIEKAQQTAIRNEVMAKNILAKPVEMRSDAEKQFLLAYQMQNKREDVQKATAGGTSPPF